MGLSGNGQSCVPPGFRFHPTDEELLYYYLKKKVSYEMIDLNVIRDVDLNKLEPWDLHERCKIGSAPQNEWYFFSHKDKKYPTGTRTNRATAAGFWKATGRDKAIYMNFKRIGMRKTLVFYTGRAPHGQKTEWIMHEYRLEDSENPQGNEDGWVVCRVFKKRMHLKGSSSAEPDRPSGSTNEEEQQQALNFPLMVDSNHSNSVGEVIHNLQSSNHEYSHHQQLNINMERHQLQQQEPQQFTNFSHEIFPQMPQLHSPDTAVIKNFIPDSLLDMNISRRSLPIDMNLQTGLPHNTTTTTSNNNIKFMQQQQHAAAADFSREDHQRRSGTADWTMLDRLIDPNNNLSHEPQQHQTQDHSKHHDQTHHHQSHTTPHSLDLCSNQGSLLRSYHNPHQPENTDFAPAHGIEYWNFAK